MVPKKPNAWQNNTLAPQWRSECWLFVWYNGGEGKTSSKFNLLQTISIRLISNQCFNTFNKSQAFVNWGREWWTFMVFTFEDWRNKSEVLPCVEDLQQATAIGDLSENPHRLNEQQPRWFDIYIYIRIHINVCVQKLGPACFCHICHLCHLCLQFLVFPFTKWLFRGLLSGYSSSGESFTAICRICALHGTVSPTRTYRLYLSHCCWARPNTRKLAPNKNNSNCSSLKVNHLQTYYTDRKQSNVMSSILWLQLYLPGKSLLAVPLPIKHSETAQCQGYCQQHSAAGP